MVKTSSHMPWSEASTQPLLWFRHGCQVGDADGASDGVAVGPGVGPAVGMLDGALDGTDMVGGAVGTAVGGSVGAVDAGDPLGGWVVSTQVWLGVVQSPSEQWWVATQPHL